MDTESNVDTEKTTLALLQRIVGAFNANDAVTLEALVSPDLDYRLEGTAPFAGRYCGHDGMRAFMHAIHTAAEGTLRVEPICTTAAGERWVVLYATVSASRAGRKLHGENVYVYEFEDGKLLTARNVPCDQYAWDAFWAV